MKRPNTLFVHILIFVITQLLWLCLLGLWIYWYVSNYIIFEKVGDQLSPQISYDGRNVFALVGGIVLLVVISFSLSLIFRQLNVQLKMTRMYDNFIATITHELKSPLSSIQLYLETLSTRNVQQEKREEFYKLMMKDANRLKKLMDSILEIAALEQKRLDHNYTVCASDKTLRQIIHASEEHLNLSPKSYSIKGTLSSLILMDKTAMGIVIDNLFDNAIKYTYGPVNVNITFKQLRKKVLIEFQDTGIGVPLNEQKKIFNKFYRVADKNSPTVKGTGLGLYWVKEIIKSHKGKISVTSEGINKGSTFKIELPVYHPSTGRFLTKLFKEKIKLNIS
ncbi:MAG: two-component sensor histidine kinase [Ignavibacteria bacterium CG2_30_36_16]|nr:HAMP domain-containing histidine kinase [Ignavibacteria bacterium]OIP61038.1 MAG: two-component sensor histidine kinase [Ignavibacteria bacterium CG2_30_36_16]PJB01550.1 MAG: sensor histidine kinase [Ignavibacteria bacterium CG_4_9_14_3_um_filter_36_18]